MSDVKKELDGLRGFTSAIQAAKNLTSPLNSAKDAYRALNLKTPEILRESISLPRIDPALLKVPTH